MNKENLLLKLENRFVDNFQLKVKKLSKGRFIEEVNFKIYLKNENEELSENPIMYGKYFSGRGNFYRPWIEAYFVVTANFESHNVTLPYKTLELLFKEISSLIPAGGKIMIPYIDHETTDAALQHGVPPIATEIGYIIWRAGYTWFKDWYYSEGAQEGDVKIQGNKPFDEEHRIKNLHELYREVSTFLTTKTEIVNENFINCRNRARLILNEIKEQILNISE